MNLHKLNNQLRTINFKKIEYLDLEITNPMKGIVSLDHHKHTCYFKNDTFNHRIHSDNHHLNSVTDLIIELGDSLQFYNKQFHNLIDLILKSMTEKNKNLREITKNQEYLKDILEENSKFIKGLKTLESSLKGNIYLAEKQEQKFKDIKEKLEELKHIILN